jgi:hypothetical protein
MALDPDYVRLKATATVQLLKVSAANIALSTVASYRRIATSVQSQVINPVTSYIALSATTVTAVIIKLEGISGEFIKYIRLNDVAQLAEQVVFSVGKSLADTISTIEIFGFSLGRPVSDSVTVADTASTSVGKNPSELAIVSDAVTKAVGKRLADSGTVSDNLSRTVQFRRSFADLVNFSEALQLLKSQGVVNNDTGSLSDILAKSVGKGFVDSSTVNAVGYLRGQDYCDFTYFAEDYVGYSRIF